jgi:hypothetical protein
LLKVVVGNKGCIIAFHAGSAKFNFINLPSWYFHKIQAQEIVINKLIILYPKGDKLTLCNARKRGEYYNV